MENNSFNNLIHNSFIGQMLIFIQFETFDLIRLANTDCLPKFFSLLFFPFTYTRFVSNHNHDNEPKHKFAFLCFRISSFLFPHVYRYNTTLPQACTWQSRISESSLKSNTNCVYVVCTFTRRAIFRKVKQSSVNLPGPVA